MRVHDLREWEEIFALENWLEKIGQVGGQDWEELGIMLSDNEVQANGVRWIIERREGNLHP